MKPRGRPRRHIVLCGGGDTAGHVLSILRFSGDQALQVIFVYLASSHLLGAAQAGDLVGEPGHQISCVHLLEYNRRLVDC